MARIISTHSFRGGTGKSNITANLAVLVARAGNRVGIIDTDIQSPGIHALFQMDSAQVRMALNDYLWGRCKIEEAAYDVTSVSIGVTDEESMRPRLFLIPSSLSTNEIARILREGYDVARMNDGLRELISRLALDYLFIDTHPGVNEETLLSIAISDCLVLVMRPDHQDFQGTAVTIELARRLEVPRIIMLANKIPPGTDMESLTQQVENSFGVEVAGVLPLNNEMARLGSGGIFTNRFSDHPFTRELRKVAERLMA